jgi:hypothetical protein
MSVTLAVAASLGLGLPLVAASAAPAAHPTAVVPAAATAAAVSSAENGSALSPGTARGSSLAGAVAPQIKWNPSCAVGSRTSWVLIFEFFQPSRQVSHWCFGFKGTWKFPANGQDHATFFCAGNNHGNIKVKWQGRVQTYSFAPGRRITWQPGSATLISLTITGWSGKNTCLV